MKRSMKRLAALFMALSMCVTMIPAVFAAPDVSEFGLDTSAVQSSAGADYQVTYEAGLIMPDGLATAAAVNKNDAALANIRFICTLTDNLIKLLPEGEEMDSTWFTFDKSDIYDLVDIKHTVGSDTLYIIYKLKQSKLDDWNSSPQPTVDEVKEELLNKATMTATQSVTPAQLNAAKVSNKITTTAKVDIVAVGGQPALFWPDEGEFDAVLDGVTAVCDAFSNYLQWTAIMDIDPYSAPNPPGPGPGPGPGSDPDDGGSGSVDDDGALSGNDGHEIEIDNTNTKGTATTEETKAVPTDKVVIDVEDIQRGYRVLYVTVKDEDGNEIKTSRVDSDSFSFVMPNGPVTIVPVYGLAATPPHESGVSEHLITDEHVIFMSGYPDNSFKPNANITRAEVATIFYALLRNKDVEITTDFKDVADNAWYSTFVNTLASLGVISGVGDNKYEPDRPITRLEFAIIASKFAKNTDHYYDFDDVPDTHWGNGFVNKAAAYGWIAGVGGNNYEPNRPITRTEVATIVNNMLGRVGDYDKIDDGHGRNFHDVPSNFWGRYEIAEASTDHGHTVDAEYIDETWH